MLASDPPIKITQTYSASPERLWSAITDLQEMLVWYFEIIPDFKAEVGFKTKFDVQAETQVFVHNWEITEVIEGKLIAYTWTFDGIPGSGTTIWEVSAEGEGSKLEFTNQVLEDFPQDVIEFKRESGEAGWKYFLGERLGSYLNI